MPNHKFLLSKLKNKYINKGFDEDPVFHPVLNWLSLMETTKFPGIRPYSQVNPFKMIKFAKEMNDYSTLLYRYSYYDDFYSYTFYQCAECRKIFTSRSSFCHHYHLLQANRSRERELPLNQVLHTLFDFICVSNVSLHAIDSEVFLTFCHALNPHFTLPTRNILRTELVSYSESLKSSFLTSVQNEYVYALIDGAKKFSRTFEAIIVLTHNIIFFWSLNEMTTTKSCDIATLIRDLEFQLNRVNARLISVTSDNASNNVAAFRDNHFVTSFSDVIFLRNVPDEAKKPIMDQLDSKFGPFTCEYYAQPHEFMRDNVIRFACICHTLELALEHTMSKFPKIQLSFLIIIRFCEKYFTNVPRITERWSSYAEVSKYIQHNFNMIKRQAYLLKKQNSHYQSLDEIIKSFQIFQDVSLSDLADILNVFWETIKELEGDLKRVGDVWVCVTNMVRELQSFKDNSFADTLIRETYHEIFSKGDFELVLITYSLTGVGRRDLIDNFGVQQVIFVFNRFIGVKFELWPLLANILTKQYNDYMTDDVYNNIDIGYEFWKEEAEGEHTRIPQLAIFALKYMDIPCSEAAVERLFAHLGNLYNKQSLNSKNDLLQARLSIKINYIFQQNSKKNSSDICNIINFYSNIEKHNPIIPD